MTEIKIEITGPSTLRGAVSIAGAKNAALPEMAASLLTSEPCILDNVPMVEDVRIMFRSLQQLGGEGQLLNHRLTIQNTRLSGSTVEGKLARKTRASILFLAPLLARRGSATLSLPGGCPIGERRVNYHLEGLRLMGAQIHQDDGVISGKAPKLRALRYRFPTISVTGTENLLMAATLARGTSILENCAREPEVDDLIQLLTRAGGGITRRGSRITIIGRSGLGGFTHRVIPDRIEAGTYLIAGAFPGNDITLHRYDGRHNQLLMKYLKKTGARIYREGENIRIQSSGRVRAVDVQTRPYPGFPTDLQAQMTTLLTQAEGRSRIRENIFENRFQHARELAKLGARIQQSGPRDILINGPTTLTGDVITSTDLRASAALVLGGLIATGTTTIRSARQLFRGYEDMPGKLQQLGGKIRTIKEDS
jgi:UDP-N-acetylglucosamine 1-carboxyvinyltransferase